MFRYTLGKWFMMVYDLVAMEKKWQGKGRFDLPNLVMTLQLIPTPDITDYCNRELTSQNTEEL